MISLKSPRNETPIVWPRRKNGRGQPCKKSHTKKQFLEREEGEDPDGDG